MEVRLPRPTEIAVRVEMPSSKEPEIKTEVIEVLETDQSQPGHYPTIRTTTIKPPDSTADATSIEGSKASNTYKKWIRESTETDIVDKLQTNMQRRGKSKKIKREEPNTFSVTMTYEQEREIVIMAVLYKEQEYSDYALMAIKWWIKGNHTDEFEKHEKYDDWRTCFIKCKKVKYWMKIYNDCGEHRLYGKPRGTRSEPITFRPYLTYDDESKIIQKAIDIKDWFCQQNMNRGMGSLLNRLFTKTRIKSSSKAIKWWFKLNYPEEYENHCKYRDWNQCFLKRGTVDSWIETLTDTGRYHRVQKRSRVLTNDGFQWGPKLTFPTTKNLKEDTDCDIKIEAIYNDDSEFIEEDISRFACDECDSTFATKQDLKTHINSTHSERTIQCTDCFRRFQSEEVLTYHKEQFHLEKRFNCTYCYRKYSTSEGLKGHIRTKHFKCNFCSQVLISLEDLADHKKHEHATEIKDDSVIDAMPSLSGDIDSSVSPSPKTNSTKKKPFKCEECDFATISELLLSNHVLRKHTEKSVMCGECQKLFHTEDQLQGHISKAHAPLCFECPQCDKKYRSGARLNRHIALDHEDFRFTCDLCDVQLRTETCLERHKYIVHHVNKQNEKIEIKKFQCEHCDKSFYRQCRLKQHTEGVHLKIKRYFCDFCSDGFYDSGALRRHVRVHTGERPFACQYCKLARFKDHGTRVKHYKYCKVKKQQAEE